MQGLSCRFEDRSVEISPWKLNSHGQHCIISISFVLIHSDVLMRVLQRKFNKSEARTRHCQANPEHGNPFRDKLMVYLASPTNNKVRYRGWRSSVGWRRSGRSSALSPQLCGFQDLKSPLFHSSLSLSTFISMCCNYVAPLSVRVQFVSVRYNNQ